jgi:hypothetical protein
MAVHYRVVKVLSGHTSPDTAYVVADYPYGFRLRCQIRYWIETKKGHGQRVVSQTSNPKRPGLVWNKPKAGVYALVQALYLDEQDHVQSAAISGYSDDDEMLRFREVFAEGLTAEGLRFIDSFMQLRQKIRARQLFKAAEPPAPETAPDPTCAMCERGEDPGHEH